MGAMPREGGVAGYEVQEVLGLDVSVCRVLVHEEQVESVGVERIGARDAQPEAKSTPSRPHGRHDPPGASEA